MKPDCASFGITEWFWPGEYHRVEQSLDVLHELGCRRLRTDLSLADYHASGGQEWYDWLVPALAERSELLLRLQPVPYSPAETDNAKDPSCNPLLADFIGHVLDRYDGCFDAVELQGGPIGLLGWHKCVERSWLKRVNAIGAAAQRVRQRGCKVVLGGTSLDDPGYLDLLGEHGILGTVDAIGLNCFVQTGTLDVAPGNGWGALVDGVRDAVRHHNPATEVWLTEVGHSTWRSDWNVQVRRFLQALGTSAERMYWCALRDRPLHEIARRMPGCDARYDHAGLYDANDRPKLLARFLADGGVDAVRKLLDLERPPPAIVATRPVLVTGGAGFIGCNLAERLCASGEHVLVLDSLARPGVEENLSWLKSRCGRRISVNLTDIRDQDSMARAVADASGVFHLAAQVAVTSSIADPIEDFETNAGGTLHLLESLRRVQPPPPIIFASTNKVYGDLTDVRLVCDGDTYAPEDPAIREFGVDEDRAIAFNTPYGCSKGCADQYVTDYAVNYGLAATVFRMSCIYGPRQFGNEDQGWVAHFARQAMAREPITIFGDGRQVRDILFVDDAVDAYMAAWRTSSPARSRVFNLGGGPRNAVSLRDVLRHLSSLVGRELAVEFADWRPCDQKYYVSDIRRVSAALDLPDPVGWREGISRLVQWLDGSAASEASVALRSALPISEASV